LPSCSDVQGDDDYLLLLPKAIMKNIELAHPCAMSPAARATELTFILVAAITRCYLANKEKESQIGLGFVPGQSVHTNPYQQEKF
jgi:hypothetical protein